MTPMPEPTTVASQRNLLDQFHQITDYLERTGRIDADEQPQIRVLTGGVSNHTVLVQRQSGQAWVMKQALAQLRVVETEWFSDPSRIHREAEGLRWLERLAPTGTTTPLIFEDHDLNLLAMEAVAQPHDNWKDLLLNGKIDSEHVCQFAVLLATIHRNAYARRHEVAIAFDDRSFFDSLRLEPYYAFTGERVAAAGPFMRKLIDTTHARRLTLVHGDYSPKNILVHQGKLVLIDHEVIHWGDPAFDLGFSMTHLLSKAHHFYNHRQPFLDATRLYWQTYVRHAGRDLWCAGIEVHAVAHTLGCLLARVAGRSPLEYLDDNQRLRQRNAAISLIQNMPTTMEQLIHDFAAHLLEENLST